MPAALETALFVLLAILAYEVLRFIVVRAVRGRLRRSAWRFIERHRVRIDPFKFGGRILIRHELANDAEVQEAILAAARERQRPIAEVRALVEEWIDEMAPRFSLATYYKFGYAVAMAWIVGALLVGFTIFQLRILSRVQFKTAQA